MNKTHQRDADAQRERDFHADRLAAGRPPLCDLELTLRFRDVTEAESDDIISLVSAAATALPDSNRLECGTWSGITVVTSHPLRSRA